MTSPWPICNMKIPPEVIVPGGPFTGVAHATSVEAASTQLVTSQVSKYSTVWTLDLVVRFSHNKNLTVGFFLTEANVGRISLASHSFLTLTNVPPENNKFILFVVTEQ